MKKTKNIIQIIFVVILVFLGLTQANFILVKANSFIKGMISCQFLYHKIREIPAGGKTGLEIKSLLPENATIEISRNVRKQRLIYVGIRYIIYPIKICEQAPYVILTPNELALYPKKGEIRVLKHGYILLAKPGYVFMNPPITQTSLTLFESFFISFFFLGLYVFVGQVILKMLNISPQKEGYLWFVATSYLMGYLFLTIILWLFLLMGGILNQTMLIGLWVSGLFLLFGSQRFINFQKTRSSLKPENYKHGIIPSWGFIIIGMGLLLIFAIFIITVTSPVRDWDAMSFWILKAKVLFYEKNFNFEYTHKNYYPLLWSLNIAAQFTLLGNIWDSVAQWNAGYFFLIFIIQIFKALKILKLKIHYAFLVVICYLIAFYNDPFKGWWFVHFNRSNAQNILFAFLSSVITVFLIWVNRHYSRNYLWLTAFLILGLVIAKLEGSIFILFFLITIVIMFFKIPFPKKDLEVISLFLLPCLLMTGWFYWLKTKGYTISVVHLEKPPTVEKIIVFSQFLFKDFCESKTPIVIGFAFMCLWLFPNKRPMSRLEWILIILSVQFVMFSGMAFGGWSLQRFETDFTDGLSRLFLDATPALSILWGSRLFQRE